MAWLQLIDSFTSAQRTKHIRESVTYLRKLCLRYLWLMHGQSVFIYTDLMSIPPVNGE